MVDRDEFGILLSIFKENEFGNERLSNQNQLRPDQRYSGNIVSLISIMFCVNLWLYVTVYENRAQRGVRKYREKIDRFLKNVLVQADGRERLGLL